MTNQPTNKPTKHQKQDKGENTTSFAGMKSLGEMFGPRDQHGLTIHILILMLKQAKYNS